jgi:serine/threonine-protein kinase HipA
MADATTYDAAQRGAAPGARALTIYSNDVRVGRILEQQDIWTLEYDPEWIASDRGWDISPALPRASVAITDGSTQRPVQWFFDNLLPEDQMRTAIAKDARIDVADSFGLLTLLGKESTGSLSLLPEGDALPTEGATRLLPFVELSQRIRQMPRVALATTSPKHMSIAGAQHKLLVGWDGEALVEPLGATASTHILKPDMQVEQYPHSVVNEYAMMKLARLAGLNVPDVWRIYCPEPAYIVQRYDRQTERERTVRLHQIDTCQLLNMHLGFKYQQANLQALSQAINKTRNRIQARMQIWRWLVFNLLIGNNDNHLKNISFMVSEQGIQIAPAYDLLCTAVYHTQAFGLEPVWPEIDLAIPVPGAPRFTTVSRNGLIEAADAIGIPPAVALRELDIMRGQILDKLDGIISDIERHNPDIGARFPGSEVHHGGELRLLRAIRHIIVADMVQRLA